MKRLTLSGLLLLLAVGASASGQYPKHPTPFTAIYRITKSLEPGHSAWKLAKQGRAASKYKDFPTYLGFEGEVIISQEDDKLFQLLRVDGAVREFKLFYDGNITYSNDINTEHGYRLPAFAVTSFPVPCQMPFNFGSYDMVQKSTDGRDIAVIQNDDLGQPVFHDAHYEKDAKGRVTRLDVSEYDGQPYSRATYSYGAKGSDPQIPTSIRFETFHRPDASGNRFATKPSVHIETYEWRLVSLEPTATAMPKSPEDLYQRGDTILYTTPHGLVGVDYLPGKSIDVQADETVQRQNRLVDAVKESNRKNETRNVPIIAAAVALALTILSILVFNRSRRNA